MIKVAGRMETNCKRFPTSDGMQIAHFKVFDRKQCFQNKPFSFWITERQMYFKVCQGETHTRMEMVARSLTFLCSILSPLVVCAKASKNGRICIEMWRSAVVGQGFICENVVLYIKKPKTGQRRKEKNEVNSSHFDHLVVYTECKRQRFSTKEAAMIQKLTLGNWIYEIIILTALKAIYARPTWAISPAHITWSHHMMSAYHVGIGKAILGRHCFWKRPKIKNYINANWLIHR